MTLVHLKKSSYIDSVLNYKGHNYAGVQVTYSSAMRQADVYACLRIVSEAIGQLPMKIYREREGFPEEVSKGSRWYQIFCQAPNDYMTAQEINEYLVWVMMVRGHAFLEIQRNGNSDPIALVPLRYFDAVNLSMNSKGIPYATWSTNDGKSKTSFAPFNEYDLFDVKLQTLNGYQGISPVQYMAETIGVGIASTRHTAKSFEHGAKLSGILSTDQTLDEDAAARLSEGWKEAYGGTDNAFKVAVLEHGLEYKNVQMTNQEAQLLDVMGHSREAIAAIYKVPVHMLNDTSAQTYSNVSENNTNFLRSTLMPYITRLEAAYTKLLPNGMWLQFDTAEFTRGDIKSQSEVVERQLKNGIISHEEARARFGLGIENPDDTFVVQSNNYVWGRWSEVRDGSIRELNKPVPTETDINNGEGEDEPTNETQSQTD